MQTLQEEFEYQTKKILEAIKAEREANIAGTRSVFVD